MAALQSAGYEATVKADVVESIKKVIKNLLQSDNIVMEIEKKDVTVKKNIRPLIHSLEWSKDGCTLHMMLALSSEGSLNPEVLFKHLTDELGAEFNYSIRRTGLYTRINHDLLPLKNLCDQ
jgi:tartrate dehydratase alpha subunit/fumarate hydratase class I-like protein